MIFSNINLIFNYLIMIWESFWKRWEEVAKAVVENKDVQEKCWSPEKIDSQACRASITEAANSQKTTMEKIAWSFFKNQDNYIVHNAKIKIWQKFWFEIDS